MRRESSSAASVPPDEYEARAAKWDTFILLRTVIEQTTSSMRTEALIKLAQLEERVKNAEAQGDI